MFHHNGKQVTAVLLCILFLIPWIVQSTDATGFDGYGYSLLENDAQRYAYETVVSGIDSVADEIKLLYSKRVTVTDLNMAMEMVFADHPEFFWYSGGYSYSHLSNYVVKVKPVYTFTGSQLQSAKAQLEAVVSAVLKAMPSSAQSDYDKALFLHDQLAAIVTYGKTDNSQTAYGALVEQKSVCAGYARAYQLLMDRAGLRCWYVTGNAQNSSDDLIAHAWNMVWLDGVCCYTDVTWDDQGENLFHYYFAISLERMSKTHFPDRTITQSCGHDTYSYFVKSAGKGVFDYTDTATPEAAAQAFRVQNRVETEATLYCAIRYDGSDYGNWVSSIIAALKNIYDFSGYKFSCKHLGEEYQIKLTVTLSPQIPVDETNASPTVPTIPPSIPVTEPVTAPTATPTTAPTTATTVVPATKPSTAPATAPTTRPTTGNGTTPTTAPATKSTTPTPSTTPTEPTNPTVPTEPTAPMEPTEPMDPTTPSAGTIPTGTNQETTGVITEPVSPVTTGAPEENQPTVNTERAQNTVQNDDSQTDVPEATRATAGSEAISSPSTSQKGSTDQDENHSLLLIMALGLITSGAIAIVIILLRKKDNA